MSDPAKTIGDCIREDGDPADRRVKVIQGIPYEWDEEAKRWRPKASLYGLPEDEQ